MIGDEELDELDVIGKGLFKAYHVNVLKHLDRDVLAGIAACKDDEERISFVHGLSFVHDRVPLPRTTDRQQTGKKSKALAQQKRTEGNRAFQLKDYPKAVRLYSAAILHAPAGSSTISNANVSSSQVDDTEELALAFANRSAALVHLSDHGRALIDIDQALENGYPSDLRYKLLERRARILSALHRPAEEVIQACQSALESLRNLADPVKRDQMELEVKRLLEDVAQNKQGSKFTGKDVEHQQGGWTRTTKVLPTVDSGSYPALSKKVRIEKSPEAGRYAVAEQAIRVGDILAVEKPYASVMNPAKYESHCHHCYEPLTLGYSLPCSGCTKIQFCSLGCRKEAIRTYHSTECSILDCLLDAGISITCFLALRMIARQRAQFFADLRPVIDPLLRRGRCDGEELLALQQEGTEVVELSEEMKNYVGTWGLVTHADERNAESFFHVTLMAHFLLECLKIANYFGVESPGINNFTSDLPEERRWIGSLLLRHLQLLQFNAHEVSELQMVRPNEMEGAKSVYIGAAVYPTLSLFNHSCEPGVVRYCIGDRMVCRAIKSIPSGEMINENYGPIFTQKSREQRQKVLKERYWFNCQCTPCLEDWPLVSAMREDALRFRCAGCRRPLIVPADVMSPFQNCAACKKSNNILQSLQALQNTEQSFNHGRELMSKGQFEKALQKCAQTLSQLDAILCPPYRDYIQCQEDARRCMLSLGNVRILNS